MKRFGRIFAIGLVLSAIGVPLLFAHRERQEGRHLRVVRDGVLYRSAQLPPSGIGRAVIVTICVLLGLDLHAPTS